MANFTRQRARFHEMDAPAGANGQNWSKVTSHSLAFWARQMADFTGLPARFKEMDAPTTIRQNFFSFCT
jgi:hypothetical protein